MNTGQTPTQVQAYTNGQLPWITYTGHLIIECNAGVKTVSGTLIDSGASKSCFKNRENFINYMPISDRALKVASGQTIPILGMGTILLSENPRIELPGSLHVSGLQQTGLVSVHHLVQETDAEVLFTRT